MKTLVTAIFSLSCIVLSSTQLLAQQPRWSRTASGDDGAVRISVSIHRDTIPPGETQEIYAGLEVLGDAALRFPAVLPQTLWSLHLRTPQGKSHVIGSKKYTRPLDASDYERTAVRRQGDTLSGMTWYVPLVNESPIGEYPTAEAPLPNLRAEGEYEVWVRYTIPKVADAPAEAWHGDLETMPVRFTVREIPVAARRSAPTREQLDHLEAYLEYTKAYAAGQKVDVPQLETVEIPATYPFERRLPWAMARTENEGLAQSMVALLRLHQPTEPDATLPSWWLQLNRFVHDRAIESNPSYRTNSLKIIGPYLDEYVLVMMREIEREFASTPKKSYRWDQTAPESLSMLLSYLAIKPQSPLKNQLEALAREHAAVPPGEQDDNRILHHLQLSWKALYGLGALDKPMSLEDARKLFGEPTQRRADQIVWHYWTGARKIDPGISGKVSHDGAREIVTFVNRDDFKR